MRDPCVIPTNRKPVPSITNVQFGQLFWRPCSSLTQRAVCPRPAVGVGAGLCQQVTISDSRFVGRCRCAH